MKGKRAFTLVELLAVMAIIALLLAILMPALTKVKRRAYIVICQTNLRSLGIGALLYSDQNDGKLFSYEKPCYLKLIAPYIGNVDEVRFCRATKVIEKPGDINESARWGSATEAWMRRIGLSEPEYGSYGLNGWIYADEKKVIEYHVAPLQEKLAYGSLNKVERPSEVPFFSDSIWVNQWPKSTNIHEGPYRDSIPAIFDLNHRYKRNDRINKGWDRPTRDHIRRIVTNRHEDVTNIVFADGHVAGVKLADLWTLRWHKEFIPKPNMTRVDGTKIYRKR